MTVSPECGDGAFRAEAGLARAAGATSRAPARRATWPTLRRLSVLGALLAAGALGAGETTPGRLTGRTMGTTFSVTLAAPPSGHDSTTLKTAIQQRLDALEEAMSTYRPTSVVSRFNVHTGTDWFPVDPDTVAVVALAQRISAETAGAFDVTIYPLVCLWGFGPDPTPPEPPSADAIARAKSHVDYRQLDVRVSPPALRKQDPAMGIDLSGIAKGYAAAAVAEVLDRHGTTDYLVAVGGEIRARGGRPGHHTWRIGLERPDPEQPRLDRVLELTQTAVSTSGDYRNAYRQGAQRYSHLLDPRTGRPVAGALGSVTVVMADSARADALATALMVMGETAGLAWADARDLACLFVSRDGPAGGRSRPSRAFAARFDSPAAPR